jgi:protein phosphatase
MTDTLSSLFETGAATDVGRVREHNEDSYLVRPDVGIWTVADGMGGHAAGEVASAAVIEALGVIDQRPASAAELLAFCEERVIAANHHINEIARERGEVLGTTVVALLIYNKHYACVWSGDSRIYLVRDGAIQQVSRDHTEAEELIAQGVLNEDEARSWPRRNIVTRAIGVHEHPEMDIQNGVLRANDTFVLCSDGLTEHVSDREILACVRDNLPQKACDDLIALTLQRGAVDNVTVIVVRYRPDETTIVDEIKVVNPENPASNVGKGSVR